MKTTTKTGIAAGGTGVIGAILMMVLANEGGYVNDPKDPGGETNYGITKQVARDAGYYGPMKELPVEVALTIYETQYVYAPNFNQVVQLSEPIAAKLIDAGVNVGPGRASKWYQQALNSFSRGCVDYACITVDGRIGPATIAAHQGLINKRGSETACKLVLRAIDVQQGNHYLSLSHMPTFTVGWFQTRIGNIDEELCNE